MGSIQSELSKMGQHAGPSTSCDARPAAPTKKKRKSPNFKRAEPVATMELVQQHGTTQAAEMLGISDSGLSTMIGRKDVSETIERLSELLLIHEGKTITPPKTRLVITRVTADKAEALRAVLNAMDIKHWDFAE